MLFSATGWAAGRTEKQKANTKTVKFDNHLQFRVFTLRAPSNCLFWPASSGLAETTSQTTSPRWAAIMVLKALITVSSFFKRPLLAKRPNKLDVAGAKLSLVEASCSAVAMTFLLMMGLVTCSCSFLSPLMVDCKAIKSFSTLSNWFIFVAAEYKAVA